MNSSSIKKSKVKEIYQIKLQGQLPEFWREYFDEFSVVRDFGDGILLQGAPLDQASLHGFLAKIRDWGLTILLIEKLDSKKEKNEE